MYVKKVRSGEMKNHIGLLRCNNCIPQVAEFGITAEGFDKYYFQDCL